jgi:plasmid stabilization system protein ParE
MIYKTVNVPQVDTDLAQIIDYYKQISVKLAKEFISQVRFGIKQISSHPFGFQVKYKNVRTLLIHQFPYHIHYIIDENLKQVVVLAIIHTYRKPQDFSSRK